MPFAKQWYLRPSGLVILADQCLIIAGLLTSLFVHFRILTIRIFPLTTICYRTLLQVALALIAWWAFGIYKRVIRFFYGDDYLNIIGILILVHGASFSLGMFFPKKHFLPLEIFIISFCISCCYIICNRLLISYLYVFFKRSRGSDNQKRVFIFGTGDLAVLLKKNLDALSSNEYLLIGFLDENKKMSGRYLEGLKVYDAGKNLRKILIDNAITDIIITGNTISAAKKSALIEETLQLQIRIAELQSAKALFNDQFNINQLATLDINDLMNRQPIQLYDEHVSDLVNQKTILVTGAAGSIGSEIVRKLCEHHAATIICVDFAESALYNLQQQLVSKFSSSTLHFIVADVRNEVFLYDLYKNYRPQIVYHAAAYKHVPLMEAFPWQAIQTNIVATWYLTKLARQFNVEKFVFISTDKAVEPSSVMGATKRLAEMIVQSYAQRGADTQFVITRFGNVLGSNGSVVPLFKSQIERGGPVTVTHPEMTRYFMTIPEACQLVLEASVMASGGEIFVFDMGTPVKILDLAKNMIRLAGRVPEKDIHIVFTGLRPGEKMHETLFSNSANMQKTYHSKILIATELQRNKEDAEQIVFQLQHVHNYPDPAFIRKRLMDVLHHFEQKPTHQRNNIATAC